MLQTPRPWHEPEGEGLYREKVIYPPLFIPGPRLSLSLIIIFRKQEFLEHEPECGVSRHRQFSKRIIGGEKAKFSELPWQAHIRSVANQKETPCNICYISGSAATSAGACC